MKLNKNYLNKKNIIRFLLLLVVLLSLAAGYYQSLYLAEHKKYLKLEDKYVRVRDSLGREATQDIIDSSYEK